MIRFSEGACGECRANGHESASGVREYEDGREVPALHFHRASVDDGHRERAHVDAKGTHEYGDAHGFRGKVSMCLLP